MPYIKARYKGCCKECEKDIIENKKIFYYESKVYCEECAEDLGLEDL